MAFREYSNCVQSWTDKCDSDQGGQGGYIGHGGHSGQAVAVVDVFKDGNISTNHMKFSYKTKP